MAGDRERLTELVVRLRRERDRCQAVGADTAWIDQMLGELEPLTADLDAAQAIRAVIERHGPGPYPADELATIAGIDADETRRVLAHLGPHACPRRADHRHDPTRWPASSYHQDRSSGRPKATSPRPIQRMGSRNQTLPAGAHRPGWRGCGPHRHPSLWRASASPTRRRRDGQSARSRASRHGRQGWLHDSRSPADSLGPRSQS